MLAIIRAALEKPFSGTMSTMVEVDLFLQCSVFKRLCYLRFIIQTHQVVSGNPVGRPLPGLKIFTNQQSDGDGSTVVKDIGKYGFTSLSGELVMSPKN